jgi:hypothetical protein
VGLGFDELSAYSQVRQHLDGIGGAATDRYIHRLKPEKSLMNLSEDAPHKLDQRCPLSRDQTLVHDAPVKRAEPVVEADYLTDRVHPQNAL